MNSPVGQAARNGDTVVDAGRNGRDARHLSARMRKVARLRAAISITNRAIIRSQSPEAVFRTVCRACVEQTDVKLAWVGIPRGTKLMPVEVAGPAAAYLAEGGISLAADASDGDEPVAAAWREQRALFCNRIQRDVASEAWRERAAANGLQALVALPLLRGGQPYGMLAAYGAEGNFFDADAVEMLLEMADNVSFAIDQFDLAEERRRAEAELTRFAAERAFQAERCENLSRRLVGVQESERRELARELHDRANPNLAAIKLILMAVEGALPADALATVRTMLADIHGLVEDTATGIREICANLRPTLLDYTGLVPTLESYAEMFTKRTGVPVRLKVAPDWPRLSQDTECMLFRVAQEALTNCAKHACARNVEIELGELGASEGRLAMAIRDDGFGFEPGALGIEGKVPGHGLISMRERAEFAGGRFLLSSHPMQGTEIRVELDDPGIVQYPSVAAVPTPSDYRKPFSEIT